MTTEPQQGAPETGESFWSILFEAIEQTGKSFSSILIEALEYRKSQGISSAEEEAIQELIHRATRQERLWEAKRKLHSLALDQDNVLSAPYGGRGVFDVAENLERVSHELTEDEYIHISGAAGRLHDDAERLLEVLVDDQGQVDALFRIIEAAGLLGRFMGEHPLQRKVRTAQATKVHKEKKGQSPKWAPYVDDLLLKTKTLGLPPSADGITPPSISKPRVSWHERSDAPR
jgi:hypothetical protein